MDVPAYASLETFDPGVLAQLHELQVEGEPSFVGGLISDYLIQVKDLNEKIQVSHAGHDALALEHGAHKLKSSSAVLGLAKLAAICFAIEDNARAGKATGDHVAALDTEYPKAVSHLRAYLAQL